MVFLSCTLRLHDGPVATSLSAPFCCFVKQEAAAASSLASALREISTLRVHFVLVPDRVPRFQIFAECFEAGSKRPKFREGLRLAALTLHLGLHRLASAPFRTWAEPGLGCWVGLLNDRSASRTLTPKLTGVLGLVCETWYW